MASKPPELAMERYFWDDPKFEPKRTFRWIVEVDNLVAHIPPQYIVSVKKPSFTIPSKKIQGLGYALNLPQQMQFNPVEIVMIDDQKNSVTDFVYYYFAKILNNFNGKQGAQTAINHNLAKSKAAYVQITMLDAYGQRMESWILYNAWVSSFVQSDLNYVDDSLATYTLTLTYDYFEYNSNFKSYEKIKDYEQRIAQPNPTKALPDQTGGLPSVPGFNPLEEVHGAHHAKNAIRAPTANNRPPPESDTSQMAEMVLEDSENSSKS